MDYNLNVDRLIKQEGKKITILLKNIAPTIISGTLKEVKELEVILENATCKSDCSEFASGSTSTTHIKDILSWFAS